VHPLTGLEGISCVDQLRHDLIERGSIVRLDTSCIARIKRRAFPTELPN